MAKTRLRLTKHFVIEEFDCHDGTRVPKIAETELRLWCEWWGEPLRARFGAVEIVSGYRTRAHNLQVGGAPRSVHLLESEMPHAPSTVSTRAVAGDCVPATGDPDDWLAWAQNHRNESPHLRQHGRGGIGIYVAQRFIHLDTWEYRSWAG